MNAEGYEEYILAMKYLRFVLFLAIYICFGYYLYLFITLKPYHPNLRCLLFLYNPTFLLTSFATFIRDIMETFSWKISETLEIVLGQASDIGIASLSFALLPLVVERIIAAIHVDNYEWIHGGHPVIGVCVYLVSMFITIMVNILSMSGVFTLVAAIAITNSSMLFGTSFFLLLPYFTARQYKKHNKNRFQFSVTVSEKYMQLENLHSAKMMRLLAPFLALSNIFFVAFYCYFSFCIPDMHLKSLLTDLFYTVEPMATLGILCISALCHHRIRHSIRTHLFRWNTAKVEDQEQSRWDTGGDHHFAQLHQAWKL